MTTLSADTPQRLLTMLDSGEKLIWWDRPPTGVMLRKSDLFTIPFFILWTGFAVFWETSALNRGAPWFFALFGIPFVVIGLYMLIGRFFHDAWLRARTIYGLTSQRVIIIERSKVKSIDLVTLEQIELEESSDGSGNITFGPEIVGRKGATADANGRPYTPTFENIKEAKRVFATIREAQKKLRVTPAPSPA
jgi:hypothetical protein